MEFLSDDHNQIERVFGIPHGEFEPMKADEKIVDAGKGFQNLKAATKRVLKVSKQELERREAAWKEARLQSKSNDAG
jgi:hypothetical protein